MECAPGVWSQGSHLVPGSLLRLQPVPTASLSHPLPSRAPLWCRSREGLRRFLCRQVEPGRESAVSVRICTLSGSTHVPKYPCAQRSTRLSSKKKQVTGWEGDPEEKKHTFSYLLFEQGTLHFALWGILQIMRLSLITDGVLKNKLQILYFIHKHFSTKRLGLLKKNNKIVIIH